MLKTHKNKLESPKHRLSYGTVEVLFQQVPGMERLLPVFLSHTPETVCLLRESSELPVDHPVPTETGGGSFGCLMLCDSKETLEKGMAMVQGTP